MKKLICHLFGHQTDQYECECARCGEYDPWGLLSVTLPQWSRFRWFRLRRWFSDRFGRCPMCGKRFCGQPDDDTHIPF